MTRAQQLGVLLGLAIVAALTVVRHSDPAVLRLAREATFDEYQRIAPRPYEDQPVRIVDIDEASLKEFGQWPWPRDRLARLVDVLADLGVAAIAFDFIFAEPDRLSPRTVVANLKDVDPALAAALPDNDALLAAAMEGRPVVLGFALSNEGHYRPPVKAGISYTGESPIEAPPRLVSTTPLLPDFERNAAGLGHINLNPGSSLTTVRSIPLFLTDGTQLYPSLALEALRVAQQASTYLIAGAPDKAGVMTSVKIGEAVVPVTESGELWLYVGRNRPDLYISAGSLLGNEPVAPDIQAALGGSIVFIGTSAPGLQDIRTTALGENVPGVFLHAQSVEQILSGRFLSRPDWADGLETAGVALLGIILVMLTFFVSPAIALVCGLALTGLALVASWFAFSSAGMLFDPLALIVAGTITQFAATSFRFLVTDRERRAIRRAFGQYLSPSLLYRIEHTRDAMRLGGDDREITVMFVDVRNFTEISERLSPTAVVGFLNTLLDALSRHVTDNEGTLDKFIGDSIMAFWNAPIDVADHGTKAVRAALAMRETMKALNARDAFGFGPDSTVSIGVGVHTGIACVGNMGAELRFNYSAVGDAVNVASRIETCCKLVGFDVLVSASTAETLPGYALLDAGALELRGRKGRNRCYAVVGDEAVAASPEFRELALVHAALVESLRRRAPGMRKQINLAKAKALALAPGLQEFYSRISRRADHFTVSAGQGGAMQEKNPETV